MKLLLWGILLVPLSYLIGSLPFGYWIGKLFRGKNFDIRNFGSGNIGMTNCLRSIGMVAGLIVFVLDVLKGYLPTIIGKTVGGDVLACFCMVGAIIGHGNSIYFKIKEGKFDGGKMVASALGGIIGLNPIVAGWAFLIWVSIVFLTRYVSLAAIIAAPSTLAIAYFVHASPTTFVVLSIAAIYIIIKHRRNINRLITKTEPKIGENKSDVTVAFLIHPRDIHDYAQNELTEWIEKVYDPDSQFSEKIMDQIVKRGFVFEAGEISGVVTKTGLQVKILLLAVPMLPDQLKKAQKPRVQSDESVYDPRYEKALRSLLESAAFLAKRRGACVLGLGGLLSSCAEGGGEGLQKFVDDWNSKNQGMEMVINNGAAYTAVSAIKALKMKATKPLDEATVAIIGAKGLIGHCVTRSLSQIIPQEHLLAVSRSEVKEIEDLAEKAQLATSKNLDILKEADIVVLSTSSATPIITKENHHVLKDGCLVLDVGYPENFDNEVCQLRPKVEVVKCGLIRFPGKPTSRIDIHFGKDSDGYMLAPACLGEATMDGIIYHLSGFDIARGCSSRGARISIENMEYFASLAEQMGFEVRTSREAEPAIYAKK